MKRLIPYLLLLSLLVPASATAQRTPLSIALEHAYHLWHIKPCNGHYRVELTTLPEWAGGYSTWSTPAGPNVYSASPTTWTDCVMQLPARDWTPEQVSIEWASDCTAVLHEWGHLTGHPHSDEPGAWPEPPAMTREQLAVMRSGAGNYSDDLPRCGTRP